MRAQPGGSWTNESGAAWRADALIWDWLCCCQVLGTPSEDNWPGISRSEELASYKFPPHSGESLVAKAPRLDSDGVGLLSSFLLFEAKKRLPAREALKHPYFSSFPSEIRMLKDSKLFLLFIIKLYSLPPVIKTFYVSLRLSRLQRTIVRVLRFSLG